MQKSIMRRSTARAANAEKENAAQDGMGGKWGKENARK